MRHLRLQFQPHRSPSGRQARSWRRPTVIAASDSARARARIAALALLPFLLLGASCRGEDLASHSLQVNVSTDLVPVGEFVAVRVELFSTPPADGDRAPATRRDFIPDQGSFGPRTERVATYSELSAGDYYVRVILLDAGASELIERIVVVAVKGVTVTTAVMTRNCVGVECPAAGLSPHLSACLDGRCVDPMCTPEAPASCPASTCMASPECAEMGCAEGVCSDGVCLLFDTTGTCGATQWCDPDVGCQPFMMGPPDAGPVDGGVPDSGPMDGGPTDSGLGLPMVGGSLVVTTTSDISDGTVTSVGALIADPGADGQISLREAIEATNSTPNSGGVDGIRFDIGAPLVGGAHTITVDAAGLPAITDPVFIDGQSEPDFAGTPVIELDGDAVGAVDGLALELGSDGSAIRGLVINGYTVPPAATIVIASDGNIVRDCYLGTDVTGSTKVNIFLGIRLGGVGNRILSNIIGAYSSQGVRTAPGSGAILQGNYIGTNSADANLGGDFAIYLAAGHFDALVGGTAPAERNVIAYSWTDGILVGGGTTGNSMLGNSIYANTNGAIDFGGDGATPNDPMDVDVGTNNLQNFPVLSSASTDGVGSLTVLGSLNSTPNTQFRIELFASVVTLVHPEAGRYLGFLNVTTDPLGDAPIMTTLPVVVTAGEQISSTATVISSATDFGDTSEISAAISAM